jgi:5'-3' exonuclease
MALDLQQLVNTMLQAAKGQVTDNWPQIKDYAEQAAKKLAENFVLIEKLKLTQQISDEQAVLQHKMQKNAAKAVFLSVQGMTTLMAEQAVKAALDSVKNTVNTALNFTLL